MKQNVFVSHYGSTVVETDQPGYLAVTQDGGDDVCYTVAEAANLRDALTRALVELGYEDEPKSLKVGTAYVKVKPYFGTEEWTSETLRLEQAAEARVRQLVREEVATLAENALDYAVKPAARQALANLAGAAELALAAVDS